jgi:hypothetical protein
MKPKELKCLVSDGSKLSKEVKTPIVKKQMETISAESAAAQGLLSPDDAKVRPYSVGASTVLVTLCADGSVCFSRSCAYHNCWNCSILTSVNALTASFKHSHPTSAVCTAMLTCCVCDTVGALRCLSGVS